MKQKLLVINVLKKEYYKDCHILGSMNVPLDELEAYMHDVDRSTPVVVYCASYSCPLSTQAWEILHKLGFVHAFAYEGGMAEWTQKGYLVQGACQQEYLNRQETPKNHPITTISAEELHDKMIEAGLLPH